MLPPFQSLESLRNNSSSEEIISPCNGKSKSNPELTLESRKSKISHTHIQLGLGQTKSKKPKPVLGSSRKTETETTMGSSKTCPVCKVFSSSSNTTLNAHIDRCLSGESTTMKWTADSEVVIKHRIKPRKMRLMADVYKSAAHCTVEELDARNGTCWANNSGFPDHEIEFQGEQEKEEAVDKDDSTIVRPPWACSKRTGAAKKNLSVAGEKSFTKSRFELPSNSPNKKRILSQQNSRKTGTLTQKKAHVAKGCEDPSDSCRVKGSDVRSKGSCSTLSSSRENLLSASIKTVSKINQKRKFSALERACESMNVSEVKTNEKNEISGPENSVSSRSLNEGSSWSKTCIVDPSCDIESVRNETRSSDNMFDSRERVIDVTNDIERQQQHYHDMSDSPVSTVSNPSLTRSESDKFSARSTTRNDEKDTLVALTSSGDWRSKGQSQSQITSFKNDHQSCCCSRKEITSSLPPPMKVPPYRESDSVSGPSKSVIRLMGKNLTVVNTDENKVNCGQFPNGHQNGFISQHPTFNPPKSLNNNAFDAMFQNCTYADCYVRGSPNAGPMLSANKDPKNSLAVNNDSFQACSPFIKITPFSMG
ncbi:hypothetical protein HanLR1_Chr05g0193351 [Helianthus annuus]|nr:hypothetical protein HanLR1_Chr05g0193351 [Helianthus annuus]